MSPPAIKHPASCKPAFFVRHLLAHLRTGSRTRGASDAKKGTARIRSRSARGRSTHTELRPSTWTTRLLKPGGYLLLHGARGSSGSVRFPAQGTCFLVLLPSLEVSNDISCSHSYAIQQGTEKARARSTFEPEPTQYRAHPLRRNTAGGAAACSWIRRGDFLSELCAVVEIRAFPEVRVFLRQNDAHFQKYAYFYLRSNI